MVVQIGKLLVVATPIGNLGDLSPRATDALANADIIACEDTRVTRKLLSLCGIDTNAISQGFFFVAMGVLVARIAGLL